MGELILPEGIEPYYHDREAGIVLYCGDCRDILTRMQAGSVDLVLTDPPYGTASESKIQKRGRNGVEVLESFEIEWDQTFSLDWVRLAANTLRDGGAFAGFTDNARVTDLWRELEEVGINPLNSFYWHKTNPPPRPRQNFCSAIETGVYGAKPGATRCWFGGGTTPNCFEYPIVGGYERTAHPTQKPELLMCDLTSLLSRPFDVVLDPFAGSGTTLAAAKRLGRRVIGIEINGAYCDIAVNRLRQAVLPLHQPAPVAEQLALEER